MSDIAMHRLPDNTVPDPSENPVGAFSWDVRDDGARKRILYICPNGQACAVPIKPVALASGASWGWDGNEDVPTLTPSINCVGGCKWHGFIQAGVMK